MYNYGWGRYSCRGVGTESGVVIDVNFTTLQSGYFSHNRITIYCRDGLRAENDAYLLPETFMSQSIRVININYLDRHTLTSVFVNCQFDPCRDHNNYTE